MTERVSTGEVLVYLQARHGLDAASERDASDTATIIELSRQGVRCDDAFEKLQRRQWSVARFGKAALNGRDYYFWLSELAKVEMKLADGSVQGILPIWEEKNRDVPEQKDETLDESPFSMLANEIQGDNFQDELDYEPHHVTAEAEANLLEAMPDMSSYEALLEGVSTKTSPVLTEGEKLQYEEKADKRWQSLVSILAQKTDVEPHELSEARIASLLGEFAHYTPVHARARLAPDYRIMRAAMLWKYLQGAPAQEIQRAAYSVDKTYIAQVSAIRNAFLLFVENKYQKELEQSVKSPTDKPRRRNNARAASLAETTQVSRKRERGALETYQRSKKPEIRGSEAIRATLCTRLAAVVGGNHGAYRKIFNLMAEVVVEDENLSDARKRLWGAVERNLQQTPINSARLNNEEVKWLAPLCGKKLVPDPKEKRLVPFDTEPETLNDMRVRANHLYTRRMYGDQLPRTADDVEFIILEATRKLLKSA